MLKITYDEIPLTDVAAMQATIELLELPQQFSEPSESERERFPLHGTAWDARPYWARYFDDRVTTYKWIGKVDFWLTPNAKDGLLRGIAIVGLNGKQEAEAFRGECFRVRIQTGRSLTSEDFHEIYNQLFNPIGYPHQRQFASVLSRVRSYFKWENGEAVESEGIVLAISQMKLPAEDVELLREVFRRLPPIGTGNTIASMDAPSSRPRSAKDLKSARAKVKQHSREFADQGFEAWVTQCLQTNTDKWSRARKPLYAHYEAWIKGGGHGQNRGEKAEAKATILSEVKWGMLMRRRFPDAWRQDKWSILYRAVLKRGA